MIKYKIRSDYVDYRFNAPESLCVFWDAQGYGERGDEWDGSYYDTLDEAKAALQPAYIRVEDGMLHASQDYIESVIVELVDGEYNEIDVDDCWYDVVALPSEFGVGNKIWRHKDTRPCEWTDDAGTHVISAPADLDYYELVK